MIKSQYFVRKELVVFLTLLECINDTQLSEKDLSCGVTVVIQLVSSFVSLLGFVYVLMYKPRLLKI